MTALEVRGLGVSFGSQQVLDDVDLVVESGLTAVLGSSGCGKTTLLRAIAGFLVPQAGSISLADRVVHDSAGGRPVPARRRGIGYVPQEGALFPHLDVTENITFGLGRARRRAPGPEIAALLELVELPDDLARRYPHELSGGQQQRVALARALAPGPGLVLLDEPFSSLDAGLREETGRAVVRALRASGAAGILVTHDQGEALSLADRVAVMARGRVLQVDVPAQIYLAPASEEVASFLGNAALLEGTIDGTRAGAPVVTCALGELPVTGFTGPGPVTVAIRPDQLVVSRASSASGVMAGVEDVSFLGHVAAIRLRVAGHPDAVTARMSPDALPEVPGRVRLTVVGAVRCFAAGGPA